MSLLREQPQRMAHEWRLLDEYARSEPRIQHPRLDNDRSGAEFACAFGRKF